VGIHNEFQETKMTGTKILIVDDREDNLLSMETILASDKYQIVKANSGHQALKILLKEQDFTLILMDVQMPILSGFETASMIYEREKLKKIPIIFITAHSYNDEIIYEGYKAGAVDYIYKPVKPELLKAKVAVFVDLYSKTETLILQELRLKAANKDLEKEVKERKQSEKKVKKLNEELLENIHTLENANAELARFAYMTSHDLQEPLRKIQMFGDLLQSRYQKLIDEKGRYYIEGMQKGSERLQTLIKDILTYSKVTENNTYFTKANLNTIINEILVDFELRIEELGAKISVGKLPELYVNAVQISQLFQNLISNALKFSRKNISPEITISCEMGNPIPEFQENGTGYCTLYFKDNGIGFDESYLDQIFTLFRRLNNRSEYEGTGIGLAICKKIVEHHKGFISARSELGKGSTFIISLPVNQPQQNGNATNQSLESELKLAKLAESYVY
jgi:signal transduction histidine kinase